MQCLGTACSKDSYFPDNIFYDRHDLNEMISKHFINHLAALEEDSIYRQSKSKNLTIYRFTWLRTFHNPIVIRLIVKKDGGGMLIAKKSSGQGGYDSGKIEKTVTKTMGKSEIDLFLELIKTEQFWELPPSTDEIGFDGARWLIEGLSNSRYHLVQRWSPKKGGVRNIGLYLLGKSGFDINSKDIY
jgi:hypothetical protein